VRADEIAKGFEAYEPATGDERRDVGGHEVGGDRTDDIVLAVWGTSSLARFDK
jgi:hypothetical protein